MARTKSNISILDELDVREFYASPRHAHHFANDAAVRNVIFGRRDQLLRNGYLVGKLPIVNIQASSDLVELHDGNASAVAWLLYADATRTPSTFAEFCKSFERVIILHERIHESGEIWHPLVPPEVLCADRLQPAFDREQGRTVRKAVSRSGDTVLFNNEDFFSRIDVSKKLGAVADTFRST